MQNIVAYNMWGFRRKFNIGDKLEIHIDLVETRDYRGILERIVGAGEELTDDEVRKYYGSNPPKRINVVRGAHRMMVSYKFMDEDYYTIVPIRVPNMTYHGDIIILNNSEVEEDD